LPSSGQSMINRTSPSLTNHHHIFQLGYVGMSIIEYCKACRIAASVAPRIIRSDNSALFEPDIPIERFSLRSLPVSCWVSFT
jgi:hypothetical protein